MPGGRQNTHEGIIDFGAADQVVSAQLGALELMQEDAGPTKELGVARESQLLFDTPKTRKIRK